MGGDIAAKTLLGRLYQTGKGVTADVDLARQLYLEAAPQFALAQTYLAELYLRTSGATPKDISAAHALLIRAAAAGEPKSMLHLAYFHMQGLAGPKDLARAAYWLDQAVSRGDAAAIFQRGVFYGKGWGGPKSESMAATLFKRSAESGYAPAQAALGMCYVTGAGVEQDTSKALKWLDLAASKDEFARKQLTILQTKKRNKSIKTNSE
jgi:TPR repeat protein